MEERERALARPRQIQELLGPAQDRYFARGYRSVRYLWHALSSLESSGAEAVAHIVYPMRWSVRGQTNDVIAPHLSSVDAIVLPLQLFERTASRQELQALSALRVSAIQLWAGTKPWFAVDAVPVDLSVDKKGPARQLKARVGNMRVRVDLVPADSVSTSETLPPKVGQETVYGAQFQTTDSNSQILRLDSKLGTLSSAHNLRTVATSAAAPGVEASQWPSPTVIDYLVTMGQLTQVLVYAFADTARSEAGPLWMRTMKISIGQQPSVLPTGFEATTKILRDRVLERSGDRIHDVLVESSTTSGVTAQSTLAYTEASTT